MSITAREQAEIERANASGLRPVVFVHGLWLLPNSWDRWRALFVEHGFATLAPGWPDDPETVAEAKQRPELFANKTVKQVTEHHVQLIRALRLAPAIIGHSFGGLITQQLAGMGLANVSVPIAPAPFRGVLPLPLSTLRVASVVLGNPVNYKRAVGLSYPQFRYGFANAVSEAEARELYVGFSVPGSGAPLFQAATANLNPWTEVRVNVKNPRRGPMLILAGARDHTVPAVTARAAYRIQKRSPGATEFRELAGRGHSLTIDGGWREVAEITLAFLKQFAHANAA